MDAKQERFFGPSFVHSYCLKAAAASWLPCASDCVRSDYVTTTARSVVSDYSTFKQAPRLRMPEGGDFVAICRGLNGIIRVRECHTLASRLLSRAAASAFLVAQIVQLLVKKTTIFAKHP